MRNRERNESSGGGVHTIDVVNIDVVNELNEADSEGGSLIVSVTVGAGVGSTALV
jgi:hypothetical protein